MSKLLLFEEWCWNVAQRCLKRFSDVLIFLVGTFRQKAKKSKTMAQDISFSGTVFGIPSKLLFISLLNSDFGDFFKLPSLARKKEVVVISCCKRAARSYPLNLAISITRMNLRVSFFRSRCCDAFCFNATLNLTLWIETKSFTLFSCR